ncbi:MAG TPA: glycosyltransferase [Candidatus Thiothrix moscowensis]|uniref:glycosyltransferase n=1 Tax=unclassified Thiothrix TaxID=2636184 RepID=UPI001A1C3F37|nr:MULTISPECIES: glycosyltransferase [unclassified Thiothrix]MBJ6609963.1 glycosyltransferase [Candidatus Thiothrix moscowensis]HRJ52868.1 glycosyltransferase [Candidatus Thiothrix moscowensis]HRJ93418.1 glycosyltransferase [Candidatus Thiothrix moscowensis]
MFKQYKRIRVVHIITNLSHHGSSMMLYRLMAHTDRSRFEPIVISLDRGDDFKEKISAHGIPVHTFNMSSSLSFGAHVVKLAHMLRKLSPDILQGWQYHGNLAVSLVSKLLPKPPVLLWNVRQTVYDIEQESNSNHWAIGFLRRLTNTPARIIYNSWISEGQHTRLGYSEQKSQVIANGFDLQMFAPNAHSREIIRQQLEIPEKATVIGMIAHHQPAKNHRLFIEAAHLLARHDPDVHFILAGNRVTADNHDIATLLQRFPELHERLHLLGNRQDIPALLNSMDIFSLTSSSGEGFSNVVGEAMACGVPCIVTDVGDTPLLVGKTGETIKNATASSLAFAWLEWINAGEIWRQEQGQQARQRIQRHYRIQHIARQYQDIYESLYHAHAAGTHSFFSQLQIA